MIVVYILLGLLGALLLISLVAPKAYEANRSIVINKSLPEVFNYLKHIKNQDEWSPWKKKDPHMEQSHSGVNGEIGFVSRWKGNKDVGEGEQELASIVENDIIETELRFFKPWKSVSTGYFKVENMGNNNTKVIWGFKGVNPIPFNLFMLIYNFDKAVGKDFDEGLSELKRVLENK